jgi:hypothetical protein
VGLIDQKHESKEPPKKETIVQAQPSGNHEKLPHINYDDCCKSELFINQISYIFKNFIVYTASWGKTCPNADGKHQSPVDIKNNKAVYNQGLHNKPVVITYDNRSFKRMTNNGHTFVVSCDPATSDKCHGKPHLQIHRKTIIFNYHHVHVNKKLDLNVLYII